MLAIETDRMPVVEGRSMVIGTGFLLLGQLLYMLYQIYFSPLSKFPGPKLWATSSFPLIWNQIRGRDHVRKRELHEKYGSVVRIAPGELSFTGSDALKDIYGSKRPGQPTPIRDPLHYGTAEESIISSGDANHTRIRRILAPAFSDRALKDAEPRLKGWATKLRDRLATECKSHEALDLLKFYNCATFDIMGDLTFSENLNMLDNGEYSSWVQAIFSGIKFGSYINGIKRAAPGMAWFIEAMLGKLPAVKKMAKEHEDYANRRVDRRLDRVPETPDLWTRILSKGGVDGLTTREHYDTASIFMIAGTETSATALSGMTYYLLRNPSTMKALQDEIRGAFPSYDDIHLDSLARLKYLHAVIEEGLRIHPPLPTSLPRKIPSPGISICDNWVPEGTVVGVNPISTVHSNDYFHNAKDFHPERWLSDSKYAKDSLDASAPFSLGARNCVGKILAYHEMRLLLAIVIYTFDLELCEESASWTNQKVYGLWEKVPLMCKVKERRID